MATNVLSLIAFWLWTESLVVLPLLYILPISAGAVVVAVATYRREKGAVLRASTPLKRSMVRFALSLSLVAEVLVILSIALYHGAQLNNLDPGGF